MKHWEVKTEGQLTTKNKEVSTIESRIFDLNDKILANVNELADYKDLNMKMHRKWHIKSEELDEEMKQNGEKIVELVERAAKLNENKTSCKDFEILKARMDSIELLEHMDKLKNYFLPKVKVFTDEIAAFRYSHEEMKEILR